MPGVNECDLILFSRVLKWLAREDAREGLQASNEIGSLTKEKWRPFITNK